MTARRSKKYSTEEKTAIVHECLKSGKKIPVLARKYSVTRKTLYAWIALYKNAPRRNKSIALENKYVKGNDHPQSKASHLRSRIVRIVTAHPEWGARTISSELKRQGYSIGFLAVHTLLQTMSLERKDLREAYVSNYAGPSRYLSDVRLEIVRKVALGESITTLSKEYEVSRNSIYKWIKKTQNISEPRKSDLDDRYVVAENHPRAVYPRIESQLLLLVKKHPEYSIHKLAEVMPVSSWTIWSILGRHNLSTYADRARFANQPFVGGFERESFREKSTLEQFVPNVAPAPPPAQPSFKTFENPVFSLKKTISTFIYSAVSSSVIAYTLAYWFDLLASAGSLSTGIGLFFATLSLLMGSLFFLYSLKYYLTLAVVLSYSDDKSGSDVDTGKSGFLGWLLNSKSVSASKVTGLESDLKDVVLESHPYVSVQIPFYNEKYVAERAITAAINFDYKGDYEVVVCDDSTDETTEIIRDFQKGYLDKGEKLIVQRNEKEGWELSTVEVRPGVSLKHLHRTTRSGFKGGALKIALTLVDPRTEFISIFDADFVPYPDSLDLFLKYFKIQNNGSEDYSQSEVAAVQGYQWHVLNKSENWITRGVRSEYSGSYVIERSGQEIYGGLKHISGSVYMIRKAPLQEVGWKTSITEDYELTLRLYDAGYKVVFTPYIQAPAECVSTLKRLIRQRMRWAEGHSYNVKLMWKRLLWGKWRDRVEIPHQVHSPHLANSVRDDKVDFDSLSTLSNVAVQESRIFIPSPLNTAEKIEFLFNIPYYLQAFFFLVGTLSWIISETIFQARLPFWTVLWGWSLVLTNMVALPLVNAVGLFLEESDEKDYSGLLSFVVLSYIVVPFQAYAAMKGFLEKEEGGWFRTPKTGRITDVFNRGKFYRFIEGILPARSAVRETLQSSASEYLSLASAHSTFNSFGIKRSQRKWIGKSFLALLLVITTTIMSFAPYIQVDRGEYVPTTNSGSILAPNANQKRSLMDSLVGEVHAASNYPTEDPSVSFKTKSFAIKGSTDDFMIDETPTFEVDVRSPLLERLKVNWNKLTNPAVEDLTKVLSVRVFDAKGLEHDAAHLTRNDSGDMVVSVDPESFTMRGTYSLVLQDSFGNGITQDFSWGVLAVNTNKSIYSSDETAYISMGILDDSGHMVCDADVTLEITPDKGPQTTLSTQDNTIVVNDSCQSKEFSMQADYEAKYQVETIGRHTMKLTAQTENGIYTIFDSFDVSDEVAFIVERNTATRINPSFEYPVHISVTPSTDYSGEVVERVPSDFEVTGEHLTLRDAGDDVVEIVWNVDWKAGERYKLDYTYQAPLISPEFYVLGPLSIGDYNEARQWQIASDALAPVVGFFSPPALMPAVGDSDLTLTYPDPRSGDLLLAEVGVRPSSVTIATPSGWTLLDSRTGTDGAGEAADTGSVGMYWFYKVATGSEGTGTETFVKTGTASVIEGQIYQARSATGTYSVAAGGYSINGDTTAWTGTLDTDIGLTDGDVVLMSTAQNGNPANTSAWNIGTTVGVNAVSTTNNEHGEFTNNTGNDIEIGLASQIVWEGTNTATPIVAVTMSAAASGVVTAIRIRQGAGTNRTDTWIRSAGRQVAGSTSVLVGYPEHDPGDLLVLFVGSRASTDPTPSTPAGWTSLGTYTGGAGSFAADSGNARTTAFYRPAEARFTGTLTVTTNTANTALGQIVSVHREDPGSWSLDTDGGADSSSGTDWSVTGSGIDLDSANGGDLVLVGTATNTDTYTHSSHALSASGITFGEVTQTGEYQSATGNDMSLVLVTGRVTAGSGTTAPTFTMTASGSSTNSPAGSSFFIKINSGAQSTPDTAIGLFSPERVWTAAGNTALNLVQPDPRAGDLMVATIAIRPSTSTVDTPSGWTLLDSRTGTDGGAEGADTGSVGMYTFYKVATGSEGISTQQFTETGTTSVWTGSIMQVRSETAAYSLASGGYSINGDATDWSGTLDSDPGLTQGDLVIVWAAQNGNPSNTSNWDLSAAGIDQKSTSNEHGEFTTNTGNDLEIDLANTIIWEGTNTATPEVTLSQSAAVSGAVAAIRIRQGAGTSRSDTWVRSAGVQVLGTTSLAVPYPDHNIGDLLVMLIGSRASTDPTPDTPNGWTSLGTYNGGTGSFGVDAGNSRITGFYKEADVRNWATQTVTIDSGNSATGQMISLHKDNVVSWTTDVDGGTDSSAGTGWSVTGSGIDLDSANGGDVILVGSSINTDSYLFSSHGLSASGMTFGDVTQTAEYRNGTGNDMDLVVSTGRVTAGTATGVAPTFTATSSGSSANSPAGASMIIKIMGNASASISVSGVVYLGDETTLATTGNGGQCDSATENLSLRVNGGTAVTSTCSSTDASFTFSSVAASSGDTITMYSTDSSDKSNRVYVSGGSADIGMDLYGDTVIVADEADGTVTIPDLWDYDSTTNNTDMLFDAVDDTTDSFTSESGIELHIWNGDTFDPGGTVTTTGTGGDIHVDDSAVMYIDTVSSSVGGDIIVDTSATFNADANMSVEGGDITVVGTLASGTSLVTMAGSGTIGGGGSITFDDLAVNSGVTTTIGSTILVDGGDLTTTSTGSIGYSGTPTVTLSGTGTLGGGSGSITFYDLSLGDGTSDTTTVGSAIVSDNTLTVNTNHTFAMATNNVTVGSTAISDSGDIIVNGTTSQSASGTVTVLGSTTDADWSGSGTLSVYNLTIGNGVDALGVDNETSDLAIDIANDFTITANATFKSSSTASLTIANAYDNSGTFTANSGVVTMDGADGTGNTLSGTLTGASAFYDLTLNNATGSWSFSNDATVTNDFAITAAATDGVIAPSGTLTIGGNVTQTDDASFVHNSGTVVLDGGIGTTQEISGTAITFNNLTASNGGRTIVFSATVDMIYDGLLTLTGTDCTNLLIIRSSIADSTAFLDDNGVGIRSFSFLDIKDILSSTSDTATNSIDSGNNTNITFSPSACGGVSGSDSATGYSFQRKTFYDDQNAIHWMFYHDGDEIEVKYTNDQGLTWNAPATGASGHLAYDTNDFSVWYESISGTEYVWMAVSESNDIVVRRGTLSSTDITWDATTQVALNGTGATDTFSYASLTLDSSNYVWVLARYYDGTNYVIRTVDSAATGDSTWASLTWNSDSQITGDQTSTNVFGSIVPRNNQDMTAVMTVDTNLLSCVWDDSDTAWEDSSGASCTSGGGAITRTTETTGTFNPGTAAATTSSFTPANTSLLVVMVNAGGTFGTLNTWNPTISDSEGLTWTEQVENTRTDSFWTYGSTIWTAPVTTGVSMTVSIDHGSDTVETLNVAVLSIENYDTADPIGGIASDNNIADGAASITLSETPASTSLVLGLLDAQLGSSGANDATPGSDFTEVTDFGDSSMWAYLEIEERTSSTSTSVSWVDSHASGGSWFAGSALGIEIHADLTAVSRDTIDTVPTGLSKNFSVVVDTVNYDVHVIYISDETTDQVSYKRWDSGTVSWDASAVLVSDAADADDSYVTLSWDTTPASGGDLYAIWIDAVDSDIYYSSCSVSTQCDTAGEWSAETAWKTDNVNTNVTSNYKGATNIFAEWTVGSSAPYTVDWDTIIVPEYLWIFFAFGSLIPGLARRKRRRFLQRADLSPKKMYHTVVRRIRLKT